MRWQKYGGQKNDEVMGGTIFCHPFFARLLSCFLVFFVAIRCRNLR
jgi:hypothetical protein